MPYADPNEMREASKAIYRRKYSTDQDFVEAEKERKREYYAKNREKIIARVLARRAKLKAGKAKVKKKA